MSLQLDTRAGLKTTRRDCPCSALIMKEEGTVTWVTFAESIRSLSSLSPRLTFQYLC